MEKQSVKSYKYLDKLYANCKNNDLNFKKKKKQVYVHNPIDKVIKFQKKKNKHLTPSYV